MNTMQDEINIDLNKFVEKEECQSFGTTILKYKDYLDILKSNTLITRFSKQECFFFNNGNAPIILMQVIIDLAIHHILNT